MATVLEDLLEPTDIVQAMFLANDTPVSLSKRLGVSSRTVLYWLSGEKSPSPLMTEKIKDLLSIDEEPYQLSLMMSLQAKLDSGKTPVIQVSRGRGSSEMAVVSVDPSFASLKAAMIGDTTNVSVVYAAEIMRYLWCAD